MIELRVGKDKEVSEWVMARTDADYFGECVTYGFFKDNQIVGGAVFYDWRIEDIVFSGAFEDKACFTKTNIKKFFHYPFNQLRCHRVSAYTDVVNDKANSLLKRLGFVNEGCFREISSKRQDANIYGMLKRECKWIGD